MRADIHGGPEHTLQSEAGYIYARPKSRQIDETLLRRTAGPYKLVKSAVPPDRPARQEYPNDQTRRPAETASPSVTATCAPPLPLLTGIQLARSAIRVFRRCAMPPKIRPIVCYSSDK
jgi:hypothetical protein